MATKVDKVNAKLKTPKERVRFLKSKMSEQSNQLLLNGVSSGGYRARVVILEQELARASADVKRLTTQNTGDKELSDGVRTGLYLSQDNFTAACIGANQGL